MPNSNKPHNFNLNYIESFYIPHPEANHVNAQEIVFGLVSSAKDISSATFQCFDGGNKLIIKAEIVANLIAEIQTKLEMIEKILPLAFESEGV